MHALFRAKASGSQWFSGSTAQYSISCLHLLVAGIAFLRRKQYLVFFLRKLLIEWQCNNTENAGGYACICIKLCLRKLCEVP
jgi:hypothetical protein